MAFHGRSFASGLVGGLVVGLAVWAYRWDPSAPPPLVSYAQQGEDYLIKDVFEKLLRIEQPTYIDIGAHHPIRNNNTYVFYTRGSHGVLVEPNPELTDLLKKARPRDVVLDVGIGASGEEKEADYFILWRGNGQLNTFDPDVAKAEGVRKVIKRKLVDVNKVLGQYFPPNGPDLFSVDTEGYDIVILRSLDFSRFRPRVICAETARENGQMERDIMDLLASKHYVVRAATVQNTVFVDEEYLAKKYGWQTPP